VREGKLRFLLHQALAHHTSKACGAVRAGRIDVAHQHVDALYLLCFLMDEEVPEKLIIISDDLAEREITYVFRTEDSDGDGGCGTGA
jgi:hypothetical protein